MTRWLILLIGALLVSLAAFTIGVGVAFAMYP